MGYSYVCRTNCGDDSTSFRRRSRAEVAHYNLRMSTTSDRGLFVWHEVDTTDLRAGEDFYSKVIGWKAESRGSRTLRTNLVVARREGRGRALSDYTSRRTRDAAAALAQLHRHARCRRHRASGGRAWRQSDRAPAYNVPSVGRMARAAGSAGRDVCGLGAGASGRATRIRSSAIFRGTSC